jgi:hypothetical protein
VSPDGSLAGLLDPREKTPPPPASAESYVSPTAAPTHPSGRHTADVTPAEVTPAASSPKNVRSPLSFLDVPFSPNRQFPVLLLPRQTEPPIAAE